MKTKILFSFLTVFIIALLAGCSGSNETASVKSSKWELDSLTGIVKPPPGRKSSIGFDAKGGAYGYGGCNSFSASYTSEGNKLKIIRVMSTEMACENIHTEANFFSALQKADKYKISGDTLFLYSEGKVIAILQRMPER